MLKLCPMVFAQAKAFIDTYHRHHVSPQGHKFSIGATSNGVLIGVVIVGRPVARRQDDGLTLEVTRLCVNDESPKNACSFLYAAAWRAAQNLGYQRMITYTLVEESGSSLRAVGWRDCGKRRAGSWSVPSRPRTDKHPITPKRLWEVGTSRTDEIADIQLSMELS